MNFSVPEALNTENNKIRDEECVAAGILWVGRAKAEFQPIISLHCAAPPEEFIRLHLSHYQNATPPLIPERSNIFYGSWLVTFYRGHAMRGCFFSPERTHSNVTGWSSHFCFRCTLLQVYITKVMRARQITRGPIIKSGFSFFCVLFSPGGRRRLDTHGVELKFYISWVQFYNATHWRKKCCVFEHGMDEECS